MDPRPARNTPLVVCVPTADATDAWPCAAPAASTVRSAACPARCCQQCASAPSACSSPHCSNRAPPTQDAQLNLHTYCRYCFTAAGGAARCAHGHLCANIVLLSCCPQGRHCQGCTWRQGRQLQRVWCWRRPWPKADTAPCAACQRYKHREEISMHHPGTINPCALPLRNKATCCVPCR